MISHVYCYLTLFLLFLLSLGLFFPFLSSALSFLSLFLILLLHTPLSSLEILSSISVFLILGGFFLNILKMLFPCHLPSVFAVSVFFAPLKIIYFFFLAALNISLWYFGVSRWCIWMWITPSPILLVSVWTFWIWRVVSIINSGKLSALLLQILPLFHSFSSSFLTPIKYVLELLHIS